ncbi:MAG TPA: class I SAM-dependent methyltransferase [Alphaproteobacteria bacterium]|nr:class I SAM-dependent methyltransferase [Alphaproteobacteria bacterium]
MSGYEDYTRVSALYDETRQPIGVEIILGCLASGPRPLPDVVLLDAGCGTGNYSRALISRVARIEAVDINAGMLDRARTKFRAEASAGLIHFHQAPIGDLPLAEESVDGVMVNQVLHHLNDDPAAGWPTIRGVITELARVLRPGGVLMINICSHEQIRHGWWYMALIPEAMESMRRRHVPIDALQGMMSECRLSHAGYFVPLDGVMQGRRYFDGRGPLDAKWRAGDSIWAMVTEDRLKTVQAKIRELDEAGALEEFVRDNDARRPNIGQFTFVCARKELV